jgi:hypothetical protein
MNLRRGLIRAWIVLSVILARGYGQQRCSTRCEPARLVDADVALRRTADRVCNLVGGPRWVIAGFRDTPA